MSKPAPARVASGPPRLDVEVVVEDERWRQLGDAVPWIEAAAGALSAARPDIVADKCAATVLLADDAHVAELNGTFRSKPRATNVLSFPAGCMTAGHDGTIYIGDIILARETIEREASELGIAAAHHIQHLVIHGLLHLIGFDHQTDDDAALMEAIETAALATLGVADPHAPELFEPQTR